MPVRVEVPVRVVVDAEAVRGRGADIDEAVAAAVSRAMTSAVDVVTHTRGDYVGHRLTDPRVRLGGAALDSLSRTERDRVVSRVADAVTGAAERVIGQARAGSGSDGAGQVEPAMLSQAPAERMDRTRLATAAGVVVLPSYQTGDDDHGEAEPGDPVLVPLQPGPRPQVRLGWLGTHPGAWLDDDGRDDEAVTRLRVLMAEEPGRAQYGVVYRRTDGGFVFVFARPGSDEYTSWAGITHVTKSTYELVDGEIQLVDNEIVFEPTAGSVHLGFVSSGATEADRVGVFESALAPSLRRATLADLATLSEFEGLDPDHPTPEATAVVDERIRQVAQAWAADAPAHPVITVSTAGESLYVAIPPEFDVPADLDVDCRVLVEPVPGAPDPLVGTADEDGSGGGSTDRSGDERSPGRRGDRGSGTGGEGTDEEGPGGLLGRELGTGKKGSVWPRTGAGGDPVACEPYLGEPSAADLVDDYGLTDELTRLAAALEIEFTGQPAGEGCRYLGAFVLHAVRTAATRARGIGMVSVRATTQTRVTVRTDGGGNNGFLDVQPGASPEFGYLQLLARLVAHIHDVGTRLVSCYLDPVNRDLVSVYPAADGEEAEPDAAGWALRFHGELPRAVRSAYMHLYAETCRVLLLQQLRSSYSGITGRQSHLEDTLTSFTQTLEILGEPVVQLSALRLAIGHSHDSGATGTVREVLSTPTLEYSPRTDSLHTVPGPIGRVPDDILGVVGTARIERRGGSRVAVHDGTEWTAESLAAAIAVRRNLVDRVDPLFLQVGDLDALYAGHRRDPQHARRFLTDLLDEMLAANTEMTSEAGDPEKGAFFALEASQYVRREGGRDARGLEYQLQGIHQLADDQLRPHVDGDSRYTDGVNDALSVKAGWDAFLMIFSTAGIIVLGLLCAPLGAVAVALVTGAAGLALTAHDISEADRQGDLYRALVDPELFQRYQDVQLAQLMAALSVAFSVFDVAGVGRPAAAIVRGARHGLRVAARGGARMGVASMARQTRREIVESMTREVMENAVKQAVAASAVVAAISYLLPAVITPVLVPWLRRVAMEHGTLAEVDAALGPLVAGQPAVPDAGQTP